MNYDYNKNADAYMLKPFCVLSFKLTTRLQKKRKLHRNINKRWVSRFV